MRNISLLKLLMEQHEAAGSYNAQTTLAPSDIDPAFSSNLDPDNYESIHPYILPPVEAGPNSGAPLEFQPVSAGASSPLGMQPQSYLAMDSRFLQLPLGAPYSTLPFAQRDTLNPDVRNEQRIRQNGEDQEPSEHPHFMVSAPSMGIRCPLLSCSRNQRTPPKLFRVGRTDNLRTHLKAVHGLPITDGVRLPKWLAENPGALNDAEDRAQASLLLKY
ncbi:hypothetical protein BGX38DRAFT_1266317 [Terfezia claveryi]|nr:hypothetical protein BGX38DRAFT_1266317 [Terfezia claveryi]